ncbi:hypothetical protein [Desulfocurvus sp.]|uniref:hypothetical protein n=1 Tax=Desulfocurvus sp. TaxID=2871698 RepID=UPI0025C5849D|nr:hypothetical protein [Desulfocurvus sp.]MCK9241343.1 hypothetical protein [Desulfocurvus sp.]
MCIGRAGPPAPAQGPEGDEAPRTRAALEKADRCRSCPQALLLDDAGPGCRCTRALAGAVLTLLRTPAPGPREIVMAPDGAPRPGSHPCGRSPNRTPKP